MKYLNSGLIRCMSVLYLAAVSAAGCVSEYGTGGNTVDDDDKDITITVSIPGQQTPTRSIDGVGESTVETVDILVFRSGTPEVLADHVEGANIGNIIETDVHTGIKSYKAQFTAKLKSNESAGLLMILANVPRNIVEAAAVVGTTKSAVLYALVHASSNPAGTPEGWKWKAAPGDYTRIPMYGETPVSGIFNAMKIENIPLTRMLARIDVVNNAAGFTLNEVYLVNYNTEGFIAPAWGKYGILESELPDNPILPYITDPQTGEANAMRYEYSGTGLWGEIYTYEALETSGIENDPSHTEAICLIIKGKRASDAGYSYYRIDFTDGTDAAGKIPGESGFNPYSVGYTPVYRNHRYTFNITAVNAPGYANFDGALKSLGILNNLKTKMLIVNENGIKDIIFNGQHYIGLGDAVAMAYNIGYATSAPCVSDNNDWQISHIEYERGTNWLSAVKNGDNIILSIIQDNTSGVINTAYVHVQAGRLTHKLKVTQAYRIFS